jgi:hypothetical protein
MTLEYHYKCVNRLHRDNQRRITDLATQLAFLGQKKEEFYDQFEVVVNLTIRDWQNKARMNPAFGLFYKQQCDIALEELQFEFEPFEQTLNDDIKLLMEEMSQIYMFENELYQDTREVEIDEEIYHTFSNIKKCSRFSFSTFSFSTFSKQKPQKNKIDNAKKVRK